MPYIDSFTTLFIQSIIFKFNNKKPPGTTPDLYSIHKRSGRSADSRQMNSPARLGQSESHLDLSYWAFGRSVSYGNASRRQQACGICHQISKYYVYRRP